MEDAYLFVLLHVTLPLLQKPFLQLPVARAELFVFFEELFEFYILPENHGELTRVELGKLGGRPSQPSFQLGDFKTASFYELSLLGLFGMKGFYILF